MGRERDGEDRAADRPRAPASEERERFFGLSSDLLCIAGLDGYFQELNPAWEPLLGHTLDELRSAPFVSFVHPDDRASTIDAVKRLDAGLKVASFMNRYRRKDGSYITLEWSATAAPERGVLYAIGRDVTEREQARALRSAHDRLRHLLGTTRVVLYAARATGDQGSTYISENVFEQFGYHPADFLADTEFWTRRLHPDDRARVLAQVGRMHDEGGFRAEYRWQRRDGAYRWVLDEGKLLRDTAGQPSEVIGTWQDITENKAVEETLRQQAAALLELSTPLIPISDDTLVMPLIGVVDSRRAAQVLETLLRGIAERGAQVAILDITGVGVVDTQVAEALLRAARAAQLLGAEVVLSGIRPDVAQTLVQLGADLGGITTSGTLQAGIQHAMRRRSAGARR